ncbi:MAG: 16S rRNA (guanine(527)-N(7))-methyltransferase RsmG [Paracoccus sp. (in: a-proteobacteria)]|uniref:16S rRNA (guanine(527)-N(7))-methyltransferase RsmG n=1 Tax=Paracoccus sp. TaxID=267 RepID=UPI0026DEC248|nr:16S rRNA (guanine(527)-N(7))-methyltransferase RsmG [Paracoccus sp. (in: a-proteobacteria)]MDO5631902.1 16S rRNA (guanine(527)-N(7))-methyltransferase RsmG [Paracoccus sp. (in: a-proteobacteria)]
MSVSRETSDRLTAYAALLRKWNDRINLIAPSTVPDLERRHISDSLQLAQLAQPVGGLWADLGSGGGLPGLVIAIASAKTATQVVLVESDQRKCAFLRSAIRELGLENATVKTARIESLSPLTADYISARALAPLDRLMPYVRRHLKPDGQAWLMKGENWQAELTAARLDPTIQVTPYASETQPGAAILKLSGIQQT